MFRAIQRAAGAMFKGRNGQEGRSSFGSSAAHWIGGAVVVAALAGWLTSSPLAQSGGGGASGPVASVKIGTASLISPSAAQTYYASLPSATTVTNSVLVSGQPVLNAPHAEITALARALRNDPDLIHAYVYNTVDTTFTYGVGKGALGALIDHSGTAFDQAQLMVLLLRAAGYSANYKHGVITLTGAQFADWTGITRADAACRLLANGGIPGSVNGSTTADCNYGSANVSTVTMAHVWVTTLIDGTNYLFDPALKTYTVKSGENLMTRTGLTGGQPLQDASSGVQTGTDTGVGYVRSLNATALNSRIQTAANTLQAWVDANLQGGDLTDLIGGREIVEMTQGATFRKTALPYATTAGGWLDIPDAYRASVRVQITKVSATQSGVYNTIADRVLFFDDIYGRKLNFRTTYKPQGSVTDGFTGKLVLVNERGEETVLASHTAAENPRLSYGQISLTVNAPYAAAASGGSAGSYMDLLSTKEVEYALPFTIVTGWGEASRGLVSKWGSRLERILPMQVNPQGCETCGTGMPATAGDARREQLAVEWLAQASRAGAIHAQIAGSVLQAHYSVGIVSVDTFVRDDGWMGETAPGQRWYNIPDSYDRIDIDTGFSLTHRTSDVAVRRAALHSIATTINALEGSVAAQIADLPDVTSTPSRFAWGNAPPSGEDLSSAGARRFYAFTSANAGTAASLVTAEGRFQETPGLYDGLHGPGGDPALGASEVNARRGRLSSTISSYASAGFSVVSSADAFLGPGQRLGTFVRHDEGIYSHRPSFQRGGALIATRYDANGDPAEIAHVTVGYYDNAKGGGGGAQPTHDAQYDPSRMADLLKDQFVDRSSAAGVDLGSGSMSYTSPASITVGQGDFPHSLNASLIWRGGSVPTANSNVPNYEPNGAWTTNWNNTLSISASGLEAMGETDVRAAAGTVAAFVVMQDVYKAAQSTEREVAGALTAAWWMKHLVGNVVTAVVGTDSQQFIRRADGQWFSPGARHATLTQTGQRTIVAEMPSCSDMGGVTYVGTRGWSTQNMSFQVRSATGDIKTFQAWQLDTSTGTQESCARVRGFKLTSWTFPEGVSLSVTYGSNSWTGLPELAQVTNSLGYKIAFDESGRNGFSNGLAGGDRRAVTVARDPMTLDPVSHTDAANTVFHFAARREGPAWHQRFVFDRAYLGRDATKPSIEYAYDVFGRVTEARDAEAVANPGQRAPHKFFIAEGFRGQREDPLGGRYTVETLRNGRASRHIDEMNRVSSAEFDGRGRVIRRTAAFGNITEFEYDERNNTTLVRRKPSATCGTDVWWCQTTVVTASYNAWNKPTAIILPATVDGQPAHTWTFDYDVQGRLITQTSPTVYNGKTGGYEPAIWRTAYDGFGRVRWTKDPTGVEARLEYGSGNAGPCLTAQHAADQSSAVRGSTYFQCNAAGDVVLTTDPLNNTSTATFDANRRKTGEYGPTSTAIKTQWTYDADGNALTESRWDSTASLWRTTTTSYSLTNKPLTVTDPAGDVARTCYDALDRARVAVDPTGRATRTSYNAASQPTLIERWFEASLSDPTCALTNTRPADVTTNRWREFQYNAGGLQSVEIDGNGNATLLYYDGLGRPMVTSYADGKYLQTLRNERDQVVVTYRRNGEFVRSWPDELGRPYWVWENGGAWDYPAGRHTRTSYDLAGRPVWTAVSTQTGTTYDAALERDVRTYVYDDAGRVVSDRIQPNNGTMGTSQLILGYEYDRANNRTGIIWPDAWRATYRYDAANRADRVQFGPSGNPTQHQADIAHDSLSRRTGLNRSNGVNTSYGYETDSDLASLSHAWASGTGQTPATFGFQHDGAGRITLTQANRPDLEWMPTLAEAATYGVPTNLNQTTSVNGTALVWDHNGNLDQHGTTDYQWTFGNRLWRVVKPASTTEYAYDSTDRRTVVIEDGVMTRTLWSGADEVGQYTSAGGLVRRFIPDGSGAMDARLAMVASDGTVSWFHTNHQGSVVAMSNGSGAAVAFANYSEYGKFGTDASGNPLSAPPGGSPFGYTGRQWDAKAGLYNYRARYYDPALGVFLSMDPIGTKDDPNLYMYVGLDPVNATDPTGKQSASAVRDRIVSEMRSEVRQLRGLGRFATSDDKARRTSLNNAADRYSSMDLSDEAVAPLQGGAATALGEALQDAPPERLIAVVPNEGGDGFTTVDTTTTRATTTARGTVPNNALGLGHGHIRNDVFPGMADPMTVLQTGLPMEYRSGNTGGAIGFDGEYMTLSPVEGASLPNYSNAPQWVQDTFRRW